MTILNEKHFSPEKNLANLSAILEYLEGTGWRVTKTSLYRHQKEGKLSPRPDGSYREQDIDRYARTFLKQKSTGKRLREKAEELQRAKVEKELKNLDIEYERKKFNLDKDKGRYLLREEMEIELAGRAGILDAGLKHWVQSKAAEWIRGFGGDISRVGEFISKMTHDLDEHINNYAAPLEYEIIIDAAKVETENESGEEALW
jgi:hypothetical protein